MRRYNRQWVRSDVGAGPQPHGALTRAADHRPHRTKRHLSWTRAADHRPHRTKRHLSWTRELDADDHRG